MSRVLALLCRARLSSGTAANGLGADLICSAGAFLSLTRFGHWRGILVCSWPRSTPPAMSLCGRCWVISTSSAFGRRQQQQYRRRIEQQCTRGGPPFFGQTAHNQVRLALALISPSPRARPSLLSMPCSPGPCIRGTIFLGSTGRPGSISLENLTPFFSRYQPGPGKPDCCPQHMPTLLCWWLAGR